MKGEAFESILDIWANITEVNGILFNLNGHSDPFRQVDISIIYAPVTEVIFALSRNGLRSSRGKPERTRQTRRFKKRHDVATKESRQFPPPFEFILMSEYYCIFFANFLFAPYAA